MIQQLHLRLLWDKYKKGKCLGMVKYCQPKMENKFKDSFSTTDGDEYIYNIEFHCLFAVYLIKNK